MAQQPIQIPVQVVGQPRTIQGKFPEFAETISRIFLFETSKDDPETMFRVKVQLFCNRTWSQKVRTFYTKAHPCDNQLDILEINGLNDAYMYRFVIEAKNQ